MDYEIDLPSLTSKKSELEGMKTTISNIESDYNGGYIKQLSSTEISSLVSKTTIGFERLTKGYNNSNDWFERYTKEMDQLENNLSNFTSDTLTSPTIFKGEFMDIFTKITIPALKTGADETLNYKLAPLYIGEHLLSYTHNGETFYLVNTKIPVEEYAQYILKNGLYQNAGLLDGQCMLLSQYYACDLLSGKYTSRSTMQEHGGSPATRMNEGMVSTNESDVLNYVYNEVNEGNPVVLQVSQVKSYLGLRHLVTVVGYSTDVKSASDLTPDKILVLDCVDGKIQTLGQARSEGGHERTVFAQSGKYLAYGPTENFKASITT